jgi:lipoate-protein ligase A
VRELDLGALEPGALHASYIGLARTAESGGPPLIVWARSAYGHLSIGASQSAPLELDLAACQRRGVAVIPRPLGGGTVWVDADQLCLFVILPHDTAPVRPAAVFDLVLDPIVAAMRRLGLNAERIGPQDIWARGRKIQGSGAATIGSSLVLGTSLLSRFDARSFAELIRCPSESFRDWLIGALDAGMTDWTREGITPDEAEIRVTLREALSEANDWRIEPSVPTAPEREAIAKAAPGPAEAPEPGARRLVRDGLKINQRSYLLEREQAGLRLRLALQDGRIARVYCPRPELQLMLNRIIGEPVDAVRLRERLTGAGLASQRARALSDMIVSMSSDTEV